MQILGNSNRSQRNSSKILAKSEAALSEGAFWGLPRLETEKVPQRNGMTKILPNVRVNFLVRFASKPLFYWVMTGNPLELFRKFFGAVRPVFWLCGSFLVPDKNRVHSPFINLCNVTTASENFANKIPINYRSVSVSVSFLIINSEQLHIGNVLGTGP